jgi:DNA-binding transcriptional MerR regulator
MPTNEAPTPAGTPQARAADVLPADGDSPRHRSGAVARMLRMPVATLRVWERRYGVTQPALSESGQRLYCASDVRRLALLKQLTDLGHAIGSLAGLSMQQLQAVASTHANALAAGTRREPAAQAKRSAQPWRVAVIGVGLGERLQSAAVLRRLQRAVRVLGPFSDAGQASEALARDAAADALVVHEPRLQPGWLDQLQATAPTLAALPKAVLYRFASEATCNALASAGTTLLREPQSDAVLGQWLNSLLSSLPQASQTPGPTALETTDPPPPRWDDAALNDFAGLSSTIACECPRHVAELLMQLSHFESYSAECRNANEADGQLHAYLQRVAATARAQFEEALEHVARHEGLIVPLSPRSPDA